MKRILLSFLTLSLLTLMSCGGNGAQENTADASEADASTASENMIEYDLTPHGMDLQIMIPDETIGIAEVSENELGGVDIMVGKNFWITINYGDGDMEMMKADLSDNPPYESSIYQEEENLLVYERTIPESGLEAEHHFFYTFTNGMDVFDVQNSKDATFGKGAIEKMVASAKSLGGAAAM